LLAKPKRLVDGKASVAIADDDQLGAAAIVVIVDGLGNMRSKNSDNDWRIRIYLCNLIN
jgi:hypothetical protein